MGIFRLLLALAVVLIHAGGLNGYYLLTAAEAVQTFFVISGFYMALILNEKYTGAGSFKLFVTNRLLRIYPAYWCVLVIGVVLWVISSAVTGEAGPLAVHRHVSNAGALAMLYLGNLFLIGQDWILFFGIDANNHLFVAPTYTQLDLQLYRFQVIPPAWSLSVELSFYLLAPWLVRRRWWVLCGLIAASLALRVYMIRRLHLSIDPWSYRFFPTELAFFLAGALAYKVYRVVDARKLPRGVHASVLVAVLLILAVYPFVTVPHAARQLALYACCWAAIPFLFIATRRSKLDRYIGELSYPIYVGHWLVAIFLPRLLLPRGVEQLWVSVGVIVGSVLFALVLVHLLVDPVDRYRQRRFIRATARGT